MIRILFTLLVSLLSLGAQAADDKMLYVEYRLVSATITPESFDAQIKKVWRLGGEFLRFEDAPNPQTKMHGLIIVAEPDIWIVDRNTNQGEHTVDPGPVFRIHFPLLASETSRKLRELEFGHELEFFHDNGATELGSQEVDGQKCKLFRLETDGREVTLFVKTDDTPWQVNVKSADYEYAVRFLRYDAQRRPEKALFQLPTGVQLKN
jgi:hypothetical protein